MTKKDLLEAIKDMLNEKDYCDYDTCVALKELGLTISDRCVPDYLECNRIHIWDAQKWLREEKKIEVNATSDFISEYHWFWQIKSLINANCDVSYPYYRSYEEALLEGIKGVIKLLKEEKK